MKTKWHTVEGYVEYAQVFEQNRDMGTGGSNPKVDKAREKTEGLYKVRFYPKDQAVFDYMSGNLVDPMYNNVPRWKDGDENLGIGKYVDFKRPHKGPYIDEDGKDVFGGPPMVVDLTTENHQLWDYEEQGTLGNGTFVRLKYTTYGVDDSQTVRLEKVGVIDHVPFEVDENAF